ncbi:hypothetical protein [Endozoicomonas sp. 2B-B]
MSSLYNTDYHQWLSQQRELLANRQFDNYSQLQDSQHNYRTAKESPL